MGGEGESLVAVAVAELLLLCSCCNTDFIAGCCVEVGKLVSSLPVCVPARLPACMLQHELFLLVVPKSASWCPACLAACIHARMHACMHACKFAFA